MESPNVPKTLAIARKLGWQFDIMSTSFFLSRRALKPAKHSGMPRWQDHLFIALSRTANDATDYFQLSTALDFRRVRGEVGAEGRAKASLGGFEWRTRVIRYTI
jgi:K+ transporter